MTEKRKIQAFLNEARGHADRRDPAAALLKTGLAAEAITNALGATRGLVRGTLDQTDFIKALERGKLLSRAEASALHEIRKFRNDAVHGKPVTDSDATAALRLHDKLAPLWRDGGSARPAPAAQPVPSPSPRSPTRPPAPSPVSHMRVAPRPAPRPAQSRGSTEASRMPTVLAIGAMGLALGYCAYVRPRASPLLQQLPVETVRESAPIAPERKVTRTAPRPAAPAPRRAPSSESREAPVGRDGMYGSTDLAEQREDDARADREGYSRPSRRSRAAERPAPIGSDGLYGSVEQAHRSERQSR